VDLDGEEKYDVVATSVKASPKAPVLQVPATVNIYQNALTTVTTALQKSPQWKPEQSIGPEYQIYFVMTQSISPVRDGKMSKEAIINDLKIKEGIFQALAGNDPQHSPREAMETIQTLSGLYYNHTNDLTLLAAASFASYLQRVETSLLNAARATRNIKAYNYTWKYKGVTLDGEAIPASNRGIVPGLSPDFKGTSFLQKEVKIKMTGKYFGKGSDAAAANASAGLKSTPKGMVWHHLDDFNPKTGECTMQLVTRKAHDATKNHTGSVKLYEITNSTNYKLY
jgi:hypothetical protein